MYNKIKRWYDSGKWNEQMVRNAVIKGCITEDQFREITGKQY